MQEDQNKYEIKGTGAKWASDSTIPAQINTKSLCNTHLTKSAFTFLLKSP